MANPQLEDGYIPISNDVLQALAGIRIPGEATQVLFVILRKTLGFRKRIDRIALSQFCEATGLLRPNVVRAINILLSMNLIYKNPSSSINSDTGSINSDTGSINSDTGSINSDTGYITSYCFNEDFESWRPLSKTIQGSINSDNGPVSKTIHTKERIYINKRDMSGVSEVILPQKVKHLEFVFLSPDELAKLKERMGAQAEQYIARLNNYIGQIGVKKAEKKYVSHYHVILNWHNKDKEGTDGGNRQDFGKGKPAGSRPQTSADRAAEVLMAIGQGGSCEGGSDQDISGL